MVVFKVLVAAGLLILGGILVMQQVINIGQFVASRNNYITCYNLRRKVGNEFREYLRCNYRHRKTRTGYGY